MQRSFELKNIGSTLIFIYWHIFIWSGLFHDGILPSARMCTCSLICIFLRKIIGKQAKVRRIGNTHCAMDKCLDSRSSGYVPIFDSGGSITLLQRRHALPKSIPEQSKSIVCVICSCRTWRSISGQTLLQSGIRPDPQ